MVLGQQRQREARDGICWWTLRCSGWSARPWLGADGEGHLRGKSHSCAILDDGTVKCWGHGGFGQLGYGDITSRYAPPATPVDLGTGRTAKAVSCEFYSTCAILEDDSLKCWGENNNGQLGVGDNTDKTRPTAVVATNLGAGVKSVATGYFHTCAVLNDGSLKCWGTPWVYLWATVIVK